MNWISIQYEYCSLNRKQCSSVWLLGQAWNDQMFCRLLWPADCIWNKGFRWIPLHRKLSKSSGATFLLLKLMKIMSIADQTVWEDFKRMFQCAAHCNTPFTLTQGRWRTGFPLFFLNCSASGSTTTFIQFPVCYAQHLKCCELDFHKSW